MSENTFLDPELGNIPLEPVEGDSDIADEVADRIEEQEKTA